MSLNRRAVAVVFLDPLPLTPSLKGREKIIKALYFVCQGREDYFK
jgi:hypothetical protein